MYASLACRGDTGLKHVAPDLALQLEEMHRDGPDLCGMVVLTSDASSGNSSPVLTRLGFLGHISVEPFADPVRAAESQSACRQAAEQPEKATYIMFESSMV